MAVTFANEEFTSMYLHVAVFRVHANSNGQFCVSGRNPDISDLARGLAGHFKSAAPRAENRAGFPLRWERIRRPRDIAFVKIYYSCERSLDVSSGISSADFSLPQLTAAILTEFAGNTSRAESLGIRMCSHVREFCNLLPQCYVSHNLAIISRISRHRQSQRRTVARMNFLFPSNDLRFLIP